MEPSDPKPDSTPDDERFAIYLLCFIVFMGLVGLGVLVFAAYLDWQ